jgi:hypothetical protein
VRTAFLVTASLSATSTFLCPRATSARTSGSRLVRSVGKACRDSVSRAAGRRFGRLTRPGCEGGRYAPPSTESEWRAYWNSWHRHVPRYNGGRSVCEGIRGGKNRVGVVDDCDPSTPRCRPADVVREANRRASQAECEHLIRWLGQVQQFQPRRFLRPARPPQATACLHQTVGGLTQQSGH